MRAMRIGIPDANLDFWPFLFSRLGAKCAPLFRGLPTLLVVAAATIPDPPLACLKPIGLARL